MMVSGSESFLNVLSNSIVKSNTMILFDVGDVCEMLWVGNASDDVP